ncbi:MAG: hypothetical protein AAF518_02745 [Spirochaetota bacterium]
MIQDLGYVLRVVDNILMWVVIIALIEPKYIIRWKSPQFPPNRRTVLTLLLPIYLAISVLSIAVRTEVVKNLFNDNDLSEFEKFELREGEKTKKTRDVNSEDF